MISVLPLIPSFIGFLSFVGFKFWISESEDHYKPELAQLLYPLFTHLYIRCIQDSRVRSLDSRPTVLSLICSSRLLVHCTPSVAARFHKRHLATFLGNPEFKLFIQQLAEVSHTCLSTLLVLPMFTFMSQVSSPEEMDQSPTIASFRAAKYNVTLTDKTYQVTN